MRYLLWMGLTAGCGVDEVGVDGDRTRPPEGMAAAAIAGASCATDLPGYAMPAPPPRDGALPIAGGRFGADRAPPALADLAALAVPASPGPDPEVVARREAWLAQADARGLEPETAAWAAFKAAELGSHGGR